MTVKLVRFDPSIFQSMPLSEYDRRRIQMMHDCEKTVTNLHTCFIGMDEDVPLGIGGIDILWISDWGRAMGEAWICLTAPALTESQRFHLAYKIRKMFQLLLHVGRFYRIQCGVALDDAPANRLVKFLGFKPEAVLHRFLSNEKDVLVYGIWEFPSST